MDVSDFFFFLTCLARFFKYFSTNLRMLLAPGIKVVKQGGSCWSVVDQNLDPINFSRHPSQLLYGSNTMLPKTGLGWPKYIPVFLDQVNCVFYLPSL